MTSETAYYGGENDTKWLSQNLWNLSGFLGMSPAELMLGSAVLDNFMDLPTGKYTATQATAGTFALTDEEGGVALASAGSTTATPTGCLAVCQHHGSVWSRWVGQLLQICQCVRVGRRG